MPSDASRWPNGVAIGWLIADHMGMALTAF
jgi:hypothetical protein